MKNITKKMDMPLLIVTTILIILGLVMIFSASSISSVLQYNVSEYYFFIRQLIFVVVGFLAGIIILKIPLKKYKYLYKPLIIIIIAMLAGLFVWGSVTNNAQSWYKLGPISIQPSEFAKTIIILYLAFYYATHKYQKHDYDFVYPFIMCGIPVFLILAQPDLGTAAIIAFTMFFIFISLPFGKNHTYKVLKIVATCGIIAAACILLFGGKFLTKEQSSRLTFQDPCTRYTEKTGYQVCNGMIAMNNGGLFGAGLGNSTQKYLYLPESHTDFIFPIIIEELGAIAGVIIILFYIIMLYRLLRIAKNAHNIAGSIIAYGTFLIILVHIFINFLGILALIPLTGVPVPFLSYGGSFTLNLIILIFLSERVAIESKDAKLKKELERI